MLLSSKIKSTQLSWVWITVGILGINMAFATLNVRHATGQQVQFEPGPIIQLPNEFNQGPPIYQDLQTYQDPFYQGPIIWPQNYYPQGSGQIIGQPQLIVPSNQVPVVGIPVDQPVPQAPKTLPPSGQQPLAAEQAALSSEKIEVLEKLLEKYKAIATEKQNDSQALVLLKQNNADLTEQMSALTQANDQALKQVQMLEKQLAANKQNPDKMRTVGQLEDSLRSAVAQVNELKQQVETLSIDNEKLLANQSDKTELVKKNQQLAGDNEKLNQRNEALTQTSEQLTQKHAVLETKYQELKRKTQDDVQSLEERIAKLNVSNENYAAQIATFDSATSAPVQATGFSVSNAELPAFEARISRLSQQNRQLAKSNTDFKNENQSLTRQFANLKKQHDAAANSSASNPISSAQAPVATLVAPNSSNETNESWGILAWLIPFLVIGLGIAFFVIIKEELHRPPAKTEQPNKRQS